MSRILMVASEAVPFIKTGGLADVIGALPPALKDRGEEVAVVLPWYGDAKVPDSRPIGGEFPIWLGSAAYPVTIHESYVRDVPYYLVRCRPLFDRAGVYTIAGADFPDNHLRFAVLSKAALSIARRTFRPDVLHCHDWEAALVPAYVRSLLPLDPVFLGIKMLLTIHNLGYQGLFPAAALGEMGLDRAVFHVGAMEYFGRVNVLKGGIAFSDAISTVSRRYAQEIQTPEFGFGLEGLLAARGASVTGILNGADYSEWNPEIDPHIPARYSSAHLEAKQLCKRGLLEECGLPASAMERPLVGMVSRLASQKGFDLVEEAAAELTAEDLSLVVLGTGDPACEKSLLALARAHPTKVAVKIAYDNGLAHRIEAGADIFLMPSRYEPCGLNQIYSLRYGTVPVVRATGGLDDTVDESTGFKFEKYAAEAMLEALRAALRAYRRPGRWRSLMLNGMARDYSWRSSAAAYAELYRRMRLAS